jgi:peptidoglycan/LPS O-acetylase OafA/YrhL
VKYSFRRITTSGNFIPEIDGLRFIAITSVLLLHLYGGLISNDGNIYVDNCNYSYLVTIIQQGHLGVPLFFVISGFILGMPFAKFHILKEKSVSLKKYFLRRLTRLEPPYILVMTFLFFASIYGGKSVYIKIASYFSSILYTHNIIYPDVFPLLNGPAWSLEIEVQFYILAPLIAYIFSIKSPSKRRIFLATSIIFFLSINCFNYLPFKSLINYIQYFLVGFLLVDIYVSDTSLLPKTKFDFLLGFAFFLMIWISGIVEMNSNSQKCFWNLIQMISIFLFFNYVLIHKVFKFLSFNLITNIGGMCYSIYLLHQPILDIFGKHLVKFSFSKYSFINIPIYSILVLFVIMTISSLFFLLIERPCMDKDWYKKLFKESLKFAQKEHFIK